MHGGGWFVVWWSDHSCVKQGRSVVVVAVAVVVAVVTVVAVLVVVVTVVVALNGGSGMELVKRFAIFFAVGGLLGDIAVMLIGPGVLAWYNAPNGSSALCNCEEVARTTAAALVNAQVLFTVSGGVLGMVGGEVLRRTLFKPKASGSGTSGSGTSGSGTSGSAAPTA